MKKWLPLFLLIFLLGNFVSQATFAAEPQQVDQLHVANTETLCTGYANCFFNDTTDLADSNALMKAIKYARDNSLSGVTINVLSPYEINSHSILVDYPVTIVGKNTGWISTSSSDCSRPMFVITAQVTIRDIYLTDGTCSSPSRDLVVVNSASPVTISHSTLENGQTAVSYQSGAGSLTVQFNQINTNQAAINSTNTDTNSQLLVVANNITANGSATQVTCAGPSSVDHNFWGTDILPDQSAPGCNSDEAKRLDAPIVTETTGVAARLMSLSSSLPSTDFYGFRASSPNSTSLYVVNHGDTAPFSSTAGTTYPCSNYFDVFLPSNTSPTSITVSLAYNTTNACAAVIESAAFCGSNKQAKYPMLWFDPKTHVTDKWDKTGDKPQTSLGSIFAAQETTCRTSSKTIEVIVDNNGRPDLLNDLFYTPFVIGYEQTGILSFTASPGTSAIALNWTTAAEINTLGFYITRSTTIDGTYGKISGNILTSGDYPFGGSYSFSDSSVAVGQPYFYKLVVMNADGSVQQTTDPVSATISSPVSPTFTATASKTLTRTPTRTPTSTLTPIYRSPTPFKTATPAFRTDLPDEPTLFMPTSYETFPGEVIPELPLMESETPVPEETPTLTPSPEPTGTPHSGFLDKTDRYSGRNQIPFYIGGIAVAALIVLFAVYLQRKH